MSAGENGQSGSGYEHAGGYKPTWEPPTLREFIFPLIFFAVLAAGNWLADRFLGRHTPGHFFTLAVMIVASIVGLVEGASLVVRGRRLRARKGGTDPARERRQNLLGGGFLIIVSLAMFAFALSKSMSAGATP